MPAHVAVPSPRGQLKGWHALLWFLGFFAFMFAVNGIFLWTAITTFPGEDTEKSYAVGLDYNQEIARRAHQTEAGWGAEIGLTGSIPQLRVRLTQSNGDALPVTGTRLQLRHPADRALDRLVELTPVGGGEFTASTEGLAPGKWSVQFSADVDPAADGDEFKASREIIIP
jgi:nitrogen fixation protein FixH